MLGMLVAFAAKLDDGVKKGQKLLTLKTMKMQTTINVVQRHGFRSSRQEAGLKSRQANCWLFESSGAVVRHNGFGPEFHAVKAPELG